MSTAVKAKAWVSQERGYPEVELNYVSNKRLNSGACFVGGGNRAFTASAGQLRALSDLGLIDQIKYLVGVSGGSYAITSYAYRQCQPDDSKFLPVGNEPEKLTISHLSQNPPEKTMLVAPQRAKEVAHASIWFDFWRKAALPAYVKFPHSSVEAEHSWVNLMSQIYYYPIGVNGNELIAWNSTHANDILSRNPNLKTFKFITPVPKSPYPIVGGTRVSPVHLWPYHSSEDRNTFTRVEFTPVYSGEPYSRSVTYYQDEIRGGASETIQVGGFIESFAFGGKPIGKNSPISDSGEINLKLYEMNNQDPSGFPIKLMTGISSNFMGTVFASSQYVSRFEILSLPTHELVPKVPMFPIHDPSKDPVEMFLADGGNLENTGIISLIQRKVEYIVVFDNTGTGPSTDNQNLQSLFGVGNAQKAETGFYYKNNQIFPEEAFYRIRDQLNEKFLQQEATIATITVKTVENLWWGVKPGFECRLTWVYLNAPSKWINRLPVETQNAINDKDSDLFKDFPYYPTQEFFLNTTQINLLAELTNYVVRSQPELFKKAFGVKQTPIKAAL
eukprot:c33569_g1_i1.p1 GENE.c33569_g1_i1~~c33569_g1_i1.p1  ORF type:complete len:573 (+),score=166.33 c33569_g1_i1:46-1719(+)